MLPAASPRVTHGRIVIDQERVSGFMGGGTRTAPAMYEMGQDRIERVRFAV
ncbi:MULTISPECIES: hypothetical protein [Streptomyces]|uniref:hypothetical protein n=1 Tax=Streptomyces TaxID=1883 RepID=UPI00345BD89A